MTRARSATRFALAFLLLLGAGPGSGAEARLAVLDFELNDLTPMPNGAEEQARTATVRPLLEKAIAETSPEVRMVAIDPQAVREADAGIGYLFEHNEVAARLGAEHGADWILVGRLTKPSFLFAYLMARLVDTRSGEIAEDIVVEVKGQQQLVTRKGVERLAEKLAPRLAAGPAVTPVSPQ